MPETEQDKRELRDGVETILRKLVVASLETEARRVLDDIEDVGDEFLDVLATVDITDVIASTELSDFAKSIDPGGTTEAVADRDPSALIKVKELVDRADLSDALEHVDTLQFWRQWRELEGAVEDLSDGEDDSQVDDADTAGPTAGEKSVDIDPVAVEKKVQAALDDAVEEARESLLEAHERVAELRTTSQQQSDQNRGGTRTSRNPTAVSTMPTSSSPGSVVARTSTVPTETRHSSAPNRQRIYGSRFTGEVADE